MNWVALCFVAVGGAVGSVMRAVISWTIPGERMPWATIAVNVLGSLLIGWLMARIGPMEEMHFRRHSFAVVGFCGGFTTFSAFSWQTFAQIQKGDWGPAAANVVLSVVLCLAATWLGWRLAR